MQNSMFYVLLYMDRGRKNIENACSVPKWKNINKDLFSIEVKEPVFYRGKETPTEK